MIKKNNISSHVFFAFWVFVIVRIILIFCTDHSMQGDATSRLNMIFEMTNRFNHWPVDIWLPFPFWYVYSGVFFIDEWIYWPRIFNVFSVATSCFPIFQLARAYFSEKVAIIGLYLFAISFPQALMDTLILSDSIYLALQIYCVYFIWRYVETNQLTYAIIFSIFNAALLLTRYESLIFNFFVLIYFIFSLKTPIKNLLLIYILPSLALLYIFQMNFKFGGHPLWGITNSDQICQKAYEIFGSDSLAMAKDVLRAFPMSFLTIIIGSIGILVSSKRYIKLKKIPYANFYVVFITLLLFYKLFTRTLIQDYRYFLLPALAFTFFGVYFLDELVKKNPSNKFYLIIFSILFITFQPLNAWIINQAYPYRFHEGFKATAKWMGLTLKDSDRVLIDRERNGTYKWHAESWGVLSGHYWEEGYHCITRDLAHDDRFGGYDVVQTEKCLIDKKINKIVIFRDGFLESLHKINHPLLKDFNQTPEFSKDGFYIIKKKDY